MRKSKKAPMPMEAELRDADAKQADEPYIPEYLKQQKYFEGWKDCEEHHESNRGIEAAREKAARDALKLEFSDTMLIIRDGLDNIIERIPYITAQVDQHLDRVKTLHWQRRVGELMAFRGTKQLSATLAENAVFTIDGYRREFLAEIQKRTADALIGDSE